MSVRFGHAVMAEDGTVGKTGALIGDQTGKEIAFRDWYKSGDGWQYLLVPKDDMLGDRAATYMEQIVPDPAFGYSQHAEQRWSGYKAIVANGGKVKGAKGDFDCATLCLACYILAGLDHAASGYTGSMYSSLKATGAFDIYTDDAYLSSGDYAKRGALYLRKGHVAMALNDGPKMGQSAHATPQAPVANVYAGEADDVDPPYVLVLGNVRVRSGPSTAYPRLFTASKGTKLPYAETDDDTGWYGVQTYKGAGFISGKKNLTRLVV
jgi:hypothetical protein